MRGNTRFGRGCGIWTTFVILTGVLGGCASYTPPDRLYAIDTDMDLQRDATKADVEALEALTAGAKKLEKPHKGEARRLRNRIIAARKYAIDVQYTKYEIELIRELQVTEFGTKAAAIGLGTAGTLVPVVQTKNLLNEIGLGMTSLDAAYNDKVLRAKLIDSVLLSMRAARSERAVTVFSNMRCSIKTYPLAMALSDLEAYYRAGTFSAGLLKLNETVSEEARKKAAEANAETPGAPAAAKAKLAGEAVEAQIKAKAALLPEAAEITVTSPENPNTKVKIKGAHKCTAADFLDSDGDDEGGGKTKKKKGNG